MKFIKKMLYNLLVKHYSSKGIEMILRPKDFMNQDTMYSKVYPLAKYSPWNKDVDFRELYGVIKNNTLVDVYRCYELWQLCNEVKDLEGDCLEVGVWKGGTGAIMAKALNNSSPESQIYLCDTFSGVVKAGENDNAYVGGEHADTSEQIVLDLIAELNLKNVFILKGMFPDDTGDKVENNRFKICHVDVDVYEGAKEITEWIWDKLVIGGIIVYDDYGFEGTKGVAKFVESQREQQDRIVIHNINGHGIIIKIR